MKKKILKQPSILSFFLLIGVSLVLMCVSVIGTMIYDLRVQDQLQIRFLDRTVAADTIFADLYDMERVFIEFGRMRTEEDYLAYLDSGSQLERDLDKLQSICEQEPETLNYIRRIRNFNIYQREQLDEGLKDMRYWYSVYTYVLAGLNSHQQQALEMAQADLMYARDEYQTSVNIMSKRMHMMVAVFIILAFVMTFTLTRFSILTNRSLSNMTSYFNRLAEKDWDTPNLETPCYREFTLISETANRMKQEIQNYIREIKNQALLEKKLDEERLINEKQHAMMIAAQLSALRAQVNPHFLFNSLNLIGVTALVGDSKMVMQMVEATGKILRYSLYHQGRMTLLDQELEIVEQYLFLQKCRFNEAIQTEIHNDLEGEEISIPTMSVQPIVENCFKHGFGNRNYLHIHISVTLEDNKVSICVMDNGIGFDPDEILKKESGGIGLMNIRKRLELLYGVEQARMEIKSEPGISTSVTLFIPQEEQNENFDC